MLWLGLAHCFDVQVAVRRAVMWQENGKIASASFLEIDPVLLNSLRTQPNSRSAFFGEVTLFLHEALYQVGKEMGHPDANQTHNMLNFLLAKKTHEVLRSVTNPKTVFHLNLCSHGFAKDCE